MPLCEHVGREQTLALPGGTTVTLARWDCLVWDEFLAWAATKLPDPRKVAQDWIDNYLPPSDDPKEEERRDAQRDRVVTKALAEAASHLSIKSARVQSLIESPEGTTYLVYLLLKPRHPDVTLQDAYAVVVQADAAKLREALKLCAGQLPKKDPSPGANNSPGPSRTPAAS